MGYDGGSALLVPAAEPVQKVKLARRGQSASARREKAEPKKDPGFGEMPKGPQQIVVNIGTQKVTLYSNGVQVAQGPVATGMPGHPTPLGVFSIIQKDRYHHSNIYSGAPMPYMQRITWSGVAMHEGALPGYPASHGCIRMSHDFAMRLWPITKLGVRVIVTRHEVAPVEFEHAKLFVPKQKRAEPQVSMNGATDGANIRLAQATTPDAVSDATGAAVPVQLELGPTLPAPADERKAVEAPVEPLKALEVTPAGAPASPAAAAPTDSFVKPAPTDDSVKPAVAPRTKAVDQPAKLTGQVAVFVSRKEKKIFVRQGMVPLFDMPITFDNPDQPIGTHVFTAMTVTDNGAGMRWNLMTIPTDPVAMMEDRSSRGRKHKEPRKPMVHVQGKPASTAAEALDRIQFSPEAIDRISELLIPGSSLVVSDTGLGPETGRYTDFIVLTR
jgi:hypothetical protein